MKKHPMQVLAESCELNVRSYSGRGMYEERCLGITADGDIGKFIADIIIGMNETDDYDFSCADIAEAFSGMRTDSMGKGTIYYFPDVPFVSDEDVDDVDEEEEDSEG